MREMTPTSTKRGRQSGVTLLELMVVVGLLVLAAGLIVPNLNTTENSAFNAQVREAAAALSYARRMAVVEATPTMAELYGSDVEETVRRRIDEDDADGKPGRWNNSDIRLAYQDDLQGALEEVGKLQLVFYPEGGSTGGTIWFVQEERQAAIRVDPITGRIRVAYNGEELDEGH